MRKSVRDEAKIKEDEARTKWLIDLKAEGFPMDEIEEIMSWSVLPPPGEITPLGTKRLETGRISNSDDTWMECDDLHESRSAFVWPMEPCCWAGNGEVYRLARRGME